MSPDIPILRRKLGFDKRRKDSRRLHGLAGGADEIAENSDVGAVGTDAAGVHGKTKALGEFEIHPRVI